MVVSDPQSFRVLFVEDDDRLAAMTARALESYGLQVDRMADGRQGLAEALKGRHDVVILDLMLPGLSGPAAGGAPGVQRGTGRREL